jgi:endonuclease/exonuclease/phosphatase family metal-dependent hydrolase
VFQRAIVVLLIGCLGGACARTAVDAVPSAPTLFTVLTWNMHGGRGDLHQLILDLEAGRLTGTTARDYILLLQEFIDRGDRTFAGAGGRPLTLFSSPVRGASSNAIVSSLALEDPRTIDLPRERQLRAAVVATVRAANTPLFVVSTHFENRLAWRDGLFGDGARERQADTLLERLPAGEHGVVGGDFNTMFGPDEPAWRLLLERFPDTPDKPRPTFRDRLVLDHLFFDLPEGWSVKRRVIAGQYGSDHHPVIAEISAD